MSNKNEFPRRSILSSMVPAEVAIYNAVEEVEKLAADVRLTEAVILLTKARSLVADFIDAEIASGTRNDGNEKH